MQSSNDGRVWLEFALTDYRTARHLAETMHPQPMEIICFHCQQCAEKSVKALLLNQPLRAFRSHDITLLLDMAQQEADLEVEETLYQKGAFLTPFGVAIRYPHTLEIDEGVMKLSLEYAESFYRWADTILEQSGEN